LPLSLILGLSDSIANSFNTEERERINAIKGSNTQKLLCELNKGIGGHGISILYFNVLNGGFCLKII
jgi:hypothetical protein